MLRQGVTRCHDDSAGALNDVDLAHLVSRRIDTRRSPLTVELDLLEGVSEPAARDPEPSTDLVHRAQAADIFNGLSDVARIIVTVADEPVRDIAATIGAGKTRAAQQRQKLFDRLRDALADSEDAVAVLSELTFLCVDWMDAKRVRRTQTFAMTRNDQPLKPEQWEALCQEQYGCSVGFLERLTMPDSGRPQPTSLGLRAHLGALFGVDWLREAIERLTTEGKSVDRSISALKDANVTKATELEVLRTAMDDAERESEAAQQQVAQAELAMRRASSRDDQIEQAARHQRDLEQLDADRRNVLANASELLGEQVSAEHVSGVFTERATRATGLLQQIRLDLQVIALRRQDISRDLEGLDGAGQDCPICRRPLDDDTRRHAHELWTTELAELDSREASATGLEAPAIARVEALEELRADWNRIEQRTASVAQAGSNIAPADPDAPDTESATQNYRLAAERAALARETSQRAQEQHSEARNANENLLELDRLFTIQARLLMAKETTAATLEELLAKTIEPLEWEINSRWSSLFPNRGHISTEPDGTISRTVAGHTLTFEAFSTAESTAALIIMRLLVAQMTTDINFAWFDEPLEHLDPDVRRHVANLLS